MFGRDDSIADGSHIDAPIQFSPQAIQKAAVCSETFLIGIQIMLEVFNVERIDVMGALLDHDGAGGVVGGDADGAVLDTAGLHDFDDFLRDIMEGGDPAAGLQFELFLKNFEFHCLFLCFFSDII